MRVDLHYNREKHEYVFTSEDYELHVSEEDFQYIKKSPNPLIYQLFKGR